MSILEAPEGSPLITKCPMKPDYQYRPVLAFQNQTNCGMVLKYEDPGAKTKMTPKNMGPGVMIQ